MNKDKLSYVMSAISKLKQRVVIKWEAPPIDLPSNVLAMDWLPQDGILAHPNTKLFISHCGLSSVNEAKYRGIPILGIPIFGDQQENAQGIEKEGWALTLSYPDLTEEGLTAALNEILTNRTYSDIAKQVSLRFRDRPMTALDTAVFWSEYVMRHNGAPHLKSDAAFLNFWQKNSLDVMAFLLVTIYVAWRIVKMITLKSYYKLKSLVIRNKVKQN